MDKLAYKSLGKISGVVLHGRGEGLKLGFRTANLKVDSRDIPVKNGVYCAYAKIDGNIYRAAVSVGVSPVFEDKTSSNIEVHIIDFESVIYGKIITVDFVRFLRPMIKFSSREEMISEIKHNIEQTKEILLD